jgi:hypothetical protein
MGKPPLIALRNHKVIIDANDSIVVTVAIEQSKFVEYLLINTLAN